jgi:predicted transcriptional regulator
MKKNLHLLIDLKKICFTAKKIQVLAHADRVEIINLIILNQSMTGTQIQTRLNLRQADTSQHLLLMHKFGFLKREQKGQKVFYSVDEEAVEKIIKISEDLYDIK